MTEQESKDQALQEYRKKLLQHKEIDAKVRTLREQVKGSKKEYDKTEDDLKALQSVGQIIAEVLRQLDEERCELLIRLQPAPPSTGQHRNAYRRSSTYITCRGILQVTVKVAAAVTQYVTLAVIVKASSGPRYVVGCRNKVDKEKLVAGTRVALDMTTLTIMRYLPREVRTVLPG